MERREVCGRVAAFVASAEVTMRGAASLLRETAELLRQEPIGGLDPEELVTLAAVTEANRSAVTRMEESLKRVLEGA